MTPDVAVVLLVATLAAMGSALCPLVTLDLQVAEAWEAREAAEDPERDPLDWEWRLRMATVSEAYWA